MTSIHSKLSRVRKPRVHITYDVETEGATLKKELPFVVGVMGDFAGQNTSELKPLKDRRFIQIDRDNFDDVLKKMSPSVRFKVLSIKFEVRHFLQMRMNILRWCPIPKSFAWARI